ncbi:ATP-dependent RNA helicase DDX23, putative [Plasmodium vinckei vinckei]|uniref:RNA helicase n=1 Tax=Plasmodium vinckei vinckei TaxID=54757 RepID=A0A449BWZ6_PLAVN|nr:ATP-dependent RNA helicase DDX23, putative [Plasmodium vinckei vinckei]VEV57943.1 ATP-dependent RNA helicase DDX23, putative [Plasmodium vinckei vinckei]
MFFFKRNKSNAQEEEKEKENENENQNQTNAAVVNNPFQNIQKSSLEEKKENNDENLSDEENLNNSGKNDNKEENISSPNNENDNDSNNEQEQKDKSTIHKEENNKSLVKERIYANLHMSGLKKKTITLYSSSSSDDDSEDSDKKIVFNKSKNKSSNLNQKANKSDEYNNKKEKDSKIDKNENKRIFANISSNKEKLVFLTKKERDENKKKLENQNEIIKNDENNYSDEHDDNYKQNKKRDDIQDDRRNPKKRNREHSPSDDDKKVQRSDNMHETNKEGISKKDENKKLYQVTYEKTQSSLAELNMLHIDDIEREKYRERELEIIKQQYLGLNKHKKKMQKPSEKFRNIFNFEWDKSEDTSKNDSNPLYQNRLEPQLLFGRGYIAGIDVREQRKRHNFYDKLVQNRIQLCMKKKREYEESGEKKWGKNESDKEYNENEDNIIGSNLTKYVSNLENNGLHRNQFIYEPKINNIIKDVDNKHWSEKKREDMTDRDWRIFREDNEIYIKGGVVPPPIRKWEESNLSSDLLKAIKKAKYEKPTPIQMQAIPIALEMRDLIGIAETGSGKTAAFVLPMLSYVKQLPPLTYETSQDGPYALIIAPSRELAIQIYEETNKFASYCSCRTVAVVGGRNAEAQAFELRRGVEIVIGTPGRLQDCLEKAYTVLNQCNYVIIDEADRMMDMGFEDAVHFILDNIPTSNLKSEDDALALQEEMMAKAGHRLYRLTQMFSATMPPSVERLSRKYLRAPAYISIGDPGAGKRSIEQKLEFITEGKKKQKLQELLEMYEPPIIVFVNQKKVADIIAKSISKMKFRAIALHGGKIQEMREEALNAFKNGEFDILVATDVAGRGIDVHGVKLVINFDLPKDIASYTHRIGRTGRAGMKGLAISFVTEQDTHLFYDLRQFLISSNNIVPLELANNPASQVKPGTVMQTSKKQILYKN